MICPSLLAFKLHYSHTASFFSKCIVPGQTLMKTLQYNLTCMIRSISCMERVLLEGLLQPINTPWLFLPEETTSALRYPNFPLCWAVMFSYRTLVELYKSHLGYWTKQHVLLCFHTFLYWDLEGKREPWQLNRSGEFHFKVFPHKGDTQIGEWIFELVMNQFSSWFISFCLV